MSILDEGLVAVESGFDLVASNVRRSGHPAVADGPVADAAPRDTAGGQRRPWQPVHAFPDHFKINTWNFPSPVTRRERAPRFGHAAPEKVPHSPIGVSVMREGGERNGTTKELIRFPAPLPASAVDRINTPARRPTGSTLTSQ
ncbi:hypothetical protein ACH4S8_01055 [Streptomyces sp. NPDC021080]|uniref:hypothetical protein n=1 Tax=Streptomyces sp. NPDC021080 TaxID=3365110 RepID=UPI00379B3E11